MITGMAISGSGAASGRTPLEITSEALGYDKALKLTAVLCGLDSPQGEEAQVCWRYCGGG